MVEVVEIEKKEDQEFENKGYKHTAHQALSFMFRNQLTALVNIKVVNEISEYKGDNQLGILVDFIDDDISAPAFVLDKEGKKKEEEDKETGELKPVIKKEIIDNFWFNVKVKVLDDGRIKVSNSSKLAPLLVFGLQANGELEEDYDIDNSYKSIVLTYDELENALLNLEVTIKPIERFFNQKYYLPVPVEEE